MSLSDDPAGPATLDRQAPKNASSYQRWMVFLLFLMSVTSFAHRTVFAAIAEPIKHDLALTDMQLGLLQGISFALLYSLLGVPLGWLADRTNRSRLLAAATMLWSLMTVACGFAQAMPHMLLSRMGVGVGQAAFLPTTSALVADHFDASRRSSVMSTIMLGSTFGSLIGAAVGGWIAQHYGWRLAFTVIGAPGCLLAIIAWFTMDRNAAPQIQPSAPVSFKVTCASLLRRQSFRNVVAAGSLASLFVNIIGAFLGIFFVRVHGADLATAGLVFGLVAVFGVSVGIAGGGFLVDHLRSRNLAWQAWVPAVGCVIAFPIYGFALNAPSLLAASLLIGLGGAFLTSYLGPSLALIQDIAVQGERASAIALNALATGLVGVGLGPLIAGILSDHFTASAFALSDYRSTCLEAGQLANLARQACSNAEATGVVWAILACSPVLLWAAFHFFLAGRAYAREAVSPELAPS